MKAKSLVVLALSICFVLGACSFQSGEQLYRLPSLTSDQLELRKLIDDVLSMGAEFAPPVSGLNRQSIQFNDLDGDGVNEAVAFFRVQGENPLKIYVFAKTGDTYVTKSVIQHPGESIDSVMYSDLKGNGGNEIIAGWQIGDGAVKAISVYSMENGSLSELLNSDFTAYTVFDLSGDKRQDLMLLRVNKVDLTGVAEVYTYSGNALLLNSSARTSDGIESIRRIKTGHLSGGTPTVLVSSNIGKSLLVTDVFAYRDGKLTNLLLNNRSGVSDETVRQYYVYAMDINSDGIIDLPMPVQLSGAANAASPDEEEYWIIKWRCYDVNAKQIPVITTYHNFQDGWYLVLPDEWDKKFSISSKNTVIGERVTVFSYTGVSAAPIEFLKIYTLSAEAKRERATIGNRFAVFNLAEKVVAAEILDVDGLPDSMRINADQVMSRLKQIEKEWNTGEILG